MKLLIQIPCLNEEENLEDVLKSVPRQIDGVSEAIARSSMRIAAYKMPVKTKFLIREGFVAE